jgi:GTP-binding protein HflX
VRDITHEDTRAQKEDVLSVITDLFDREEDIPPIIEVWNKMDQADDALHAMVHTDKTSNALPISAHTGDGLGRLSQVVADTLSTHHYRHCTYQLPASAGQAIAWLHQHGIVDNVSTTDNAAMAIQARLTPADIGRFARQFPELVDEQEAVAISGS